MWSLSSDKRTDCISLLAEQIFVICKCLVYMRVCSVAVSSSFSAFVVTFLRLFSCCCSPWMDNETSDPLGIDMWKAPLALLFFFSLSKHTQIERDIASLFGTLLSFSVILWVFVVVRLSFTRNVNICPAEPFSNPSMLPPTINQWRAWNIVCHAHTCHHKAGTRYNNDTMVLLRVSTEAFRFCLYIACWYYVLI